MLLALLGCVSPSDSSPKPADETGADSAPDTHGDTDSGGDTSGPDDPPPTLILITLDTLRGDHVGELTPFLREMAAGGLELRDLDTHTWTYPGIGAVLTGVHPALWGIEAWTPDPAPDDMPYQLPDSIPTLAERLAALGWATAYWNSNGIAGSKSGLDRGYGFTVEYTEGFTTGQATAMADWLADQRGLPRFLHLHVNDPHSPYDLFSDTCAEEVAALDDGTCRWDFVDVNEDSLFANDEVRDGRFTEASEDYEACRAVLAAAYACEVRFQDEVLRVVWDALSAEGDLDDALTLFVVDHGEGLLDPWTNHGFDPRMPVIDGWGLVHWPGHVSPGVNTLPTAQEDILPTITALLDLDLGIDATGFPVEEVPADRVRTTFHGGMLPSVGRWGDVWSAHDPQYHYIVDSFGGCALYDHAADPGELVNLCAEGTVPEPLSTAIDELRTITEGYNEPPGP